MITFTAKFLRDGSTSYICKETGTRYIVSEAGRECAAYREGELIRTGDRKTCVDAIESDAKWTARELA